MANGYQVEELVEAQHVVVAVIKQTDFIVHVQSYLIRGSIDDLIDIWGYFAAINVTDFNYINHDRLNSFNSNTEAIVVLKDHDYGCVVNYLHYYLQKLLLIHFSFVLKLKVTSKSFKVIQGYRN